MGFPTKGLCILMVFSVRFLNAKFNLFVLLTNAIKVGGSVSICAMYDILHALFFAKLGGL